MQSSTQANKIINVSSSNRLVRCKGKCGKESRRKRKSRPLTYHSVKFQYPNRKFTCLECNHSFLLPNSRMD